MSLSCKKESGEATIGCLRGLNASQILNTPFPFNAPLVVTDGFFLDKSRREYMEDENSVNSDIPVLLGSNANEGFIFLMIMLPDIMPYRDRVIGRLKTNWLVDLKMGNGWSSITLIQ